jgi:hypothetical protein
MAWGPILPLRYASPVSAESPSSGRSVTPRDPIRTFLGEDYAYWRAVHDLYQREELEKAHRIAIELGAGLGGGGLDWLRLLEAELAAKKKARRLAVSPWLSLDYIPQEVPEPATVGETALACADRLGSRFDWKHEEPTVLAILPEEFDNPYSIHRYGYCVPKRDFFKICMPLSSLHSPNVFEDTFVHEYAHVISESLSAGKVADWVSEGFSVFAAGEYDAEALRDFQDHPDWWLAPKELALTISSRGSDEEFPHERYMAYQQSGLVIRFLAQLRGERMLSRLLKAYTGTGFWRDMQALVLGSDPASHAVESVYGMDLRTLFESAYRAIRRS